MTLCIVTIVVCEVADTVRLYLWCIVILFFFFKQKTAYEMRISDWSSDVCSSDLTGSAARGSAAVPPTVAAYCRDKRDLEVGTYASAEAQVAALSDDIAYNNHDIDDGLRAQLFPLDDLRDLPLVGPVLDEVERLYPGLEEIGRAHV